MNTLHTIAIAPSPRDKHKAPTHPLHHPLSLRQTLTLPWRLWWNFHHYTVLLWKSNRINITVSI